MNIRREFHVATEGWPFLGLAGVVAGASWHYAGWLPALLPAALFVVVLLVFRDPERGVPATPLGVVSPVDGRVESAGPAGAGTREAGAISVRIRIDPFGTYTARSPVEGKAEDAPGPGARLGSPGGHAALWLQTDQAKDVVLYFDGYRLGLAPRSILRYGERVGQGQRCAYLRLARYAVVELPPDARLVVEPGQRVLAGRDLLAKLPHS